MTTERKYWFPAKRYGWGWGLPVCWQGWVCLALYGAGIALAMHVFRPARETGLFSLSVVVLTLGLLTACAIKGEPPGWRSGD